MSSLWTPSGEHKVGRPSPEGEETARPAGSQGPSTPASPVGTGPAASGRPDEAELDDMRRQLADAPVEVVIANHAYGLFELAALYLGSVPPQLDKARLAVDALGVLVEGLSGSLGEVEASLNEALAQIRLAYVQISAAQPGAGQTGAGQTGAGQTGAGQTGSGRTGPDAAREKGG